MALPFNYTGHLWSEKPADEYAGISSADMARQFLKKFPSEKVLHQQITDDSAELTSNISLFNINYEVTVTFSRGTYHSAVFTIQLNNVIFATLGALVASALLSGFTLSHFIWFSVIFTLVFYSVNVWFIVAAVQQRIKKLPQFAPYNFETAERLSDEQQAWLANKERCPGCGESVTEYHTHCPECGLKLPGPRKTSPSSISQFRFKEIHYNYREKDRDEDSE